MIAESKLLTVWAVYWTGVYEGGLSAIYLTEEAAKRHVEMHPEDDCYVRATAVLAWPVGDQRLAESM